MNRNVNPEDTAANYYVLCSNEYVEVENIRREWKNKYREYTTCINQCLAQKCNDNTNEARRGCENSVRSICDREDCSNINQQVHAWAQSYQAANIALQNNCIATNCSMPQDPSRIPTRLPNPTGGSGGSD